jgi:MoaA/NifB/PqqE/SkfB family radical SAM enzyme
MMLTPEENIALARRERNAGLAVVQSTPATVTIESTSICNLRCVMCPHAIGAVDRPKHMPEELIPRLSGPLAAARDVQLHGIGEPLASPAFWRALESGSFHPDCVVNVNTNLTLLNDRRLGLLVGSTARLALNISIDAATETTYGRIRGASFDELLTNIRRLVAARAGRPQPKIFVNMTLMRENIEEAPGFVELAHGLGVDGVYMWQMNRWPDEYMERYRITRDGWHFDYATQGLWNHPELSDRSLRDAQRRARTLGMPLVLEGFKEVFFDVDEAAPAPAITPAAPAAPPPPVASIETIRDCRAPWEWALVTTSGQVRPCCFARGTVGNLNDSSFEEIWNGPKIQALRQDMLAGRVNRVCRDAPCKYVQNTQVPIAERSLPIRLERQLRLGLRRVARRIFVRLPNAHQRRLLALVGRFASRG